MFLEAAARVTAKLQMSMSWRGVHDTPDEVRRDSHDEQAQPFPLHPIDIPMELVRAGEALLRSPQPLLPFLAPSAYRTAASKRIAVLPRQCLRQQTPSRALSTSAPRQAENDDFSDLLDKTLDQNKSVPTAPTPRTSRFGSNRAKRTNPSERMAAERARNTDSLGDIFNSYKNSSRTSRGGLSDIANMLRDDDSVDPNRPTAPATPPPPPVPPMKLNSTVGRTIQVNENRAMDVGRAFRTLESRCAQNSVKRDFMRQRFHERPGLKRKRLKSERWRRRFKESFRETIKLVQGLKKQGW